MRKKFANLCRCGTGRYCHRHRQYGLHEVQRRDDEPRTRRDPQPEGTATCLENQKCGGGRRVNLKSIGSI